MTKYPAKILLALGEAIGGNEDIYKWLLKNGYPELAAFTSMMKLSREAFDWLMKNGYPQLAAVGGAINEDPEAYKWLKKNGFEVLARFADAAGGDKKAIFWLGDNDLKIFVVLALKIKKLHDEYASDNKWYYKIHFK